MQRKFGRAAARFVIVIAAVSLTGCAETPGPDPERDAIDGWKRGELAVYIADNTDGRSETSYMLRDTLDGAQFDTRLLFDGEPAPELVSGVRLRVSGVETPDGLCVTNYSLLPAATETVQSPLIAGSPYPVRSFAFVLINLNGNGVNTDANAVMGRLISNPDSIRNYYLDDSYARQDITAQVFGPINYTMTSCSNTDAGNLSKALVPMITGTFQHYLWYLGTSQGSPCTWGGLGSVGSPQSPAKDTWYNGSTSCVVLVQEPGHNFGMQHSSSLACGTSAAFLDDPNGCTDSEYGDRFDPMGGGCRHMNAWQMQYQGWFGGCNGVRITNTGTFTLLPFEPQCNGVQFLQIAMPKSRPYNRPAGGGSSGGTDTLTSYYVELRTPVDFDGTLAANSTALTARVLIHAGAAPRTRTQTGIHTYLLDMNPATTGSSGLNDAGLSVGQTFNDPAGGLTITNMAMSNSQATIQVTYTNGSGAPTCLDSTTFSPPGPSDCSMTGTGGTGGSTGTGGRGGTTGTAGTGGTTGSGGRGGTTGAGGSTGGAAGRGGTTGAGGTTGTGGRGGTTGAGGAIVTGGTTGTAGSGGAAGGSATGNGGTTGAAGTGPATGTAGTTGAGGTSTGSAGAGMVSGTGGTIVPTGSAGTGAPSGTGGVGVPTGGVGPGAAGQGQNPGEITGGCSCETAGGGTPSTWAVMLGLAFVAARRGRFLRRRRLPATPDHDPREEDGR